MSLTIIVDLSIRSKEFQVIFPCPSPATVFLGIWVVYYGVNFGKKYFMTNSIKEIEPVFVVLIFGT